MWPTDIFRKGDDSTRSRRQKTTPIIMYVSLTMICQPPNVPSTLETSGKFKVKSGEVSKGIFLSYLSDVFFPLGFDLPATHDTIGICWRNNTVALELNRVDIPEPALDHFKRRCGRVCEMFRDGFPPCMTQRRLFIVTGRRGNKNEFLRHCE